MIPHFTIIIGAFKCGTTSLFHYLDEHPEVCASRVREPNFFSSEEHFARGRHWYESLWDWDPHRHRTALETSPAYSMFPVYPSAAKNMCGFGPEIKLIYIVRDPLDQIASNYTQALSMGSPWTDPQSEWWEGHRINRFFLCAASYAQQIDEYRRYFAPSKILLLRFEELRDDPQGVLARICRFIGIDESFHFRRSGQIANPTEGKIVPRPAWNALKRVHFLRAVFHRLPTPVRHRLHAVAGKKLRKPLVLTAEEERYVLSCLGEGLTRLQEEYGLDISTWRTTRLSREIVDAV